LVDGGATHNFIDLALMAKRGIPIEYFEGFSVVVVDGYNMTCTQRIPRLDVILGNYTLTDDFYVVELADTKVVLGVQWLYSLGKHSINYQAMELEFRATNGKKVVLRDMSNGSLRIVLAKRMEGIFLHGDVACATKCLITSQNPSDNNQQCHVDIHELLRTHDRVFGEIPPGRSPDRGFEHTIELEEGAKPVITTPYRHPKKSKDEIEKAIKVLLEMGHIRPSLLLMINMFLLLCFYCLKRCTFGRALISISTY
jgi:hypothetical protein